MNLPIQPEGRHSVLSRAAAHVLNTTAIAWSLSGCRPVPIGASNFLEPAVAAATPVVCLVNSGRDWYPREA